jgi:hypothetical protein
MAVCIRYTYTGESNLRKDYPEYKRHFKNWLNKQNTFEPAPIIQLKSEKTHVTDKDVEKYRKHI